MLPALLPCLLPSMHLPCCPQAAACPWCAGQVSAVSPKTNTTEVTRLGAFTYGDAQVVLYDTPGVVDKQ